MENPLLRDLSPSAQAMVKEIISAINQGHRQVFDAVVELRHEVTSLKNEVTKPKAPKRHRTPEERTVSPTAMAGIKETLAAYPNGFTTKEAQPFFVPKGFKEHSVQPALTLAALKGILVRGWRTGDAFTRPIVEYRAPAPRGLMARLNPGA